jgi:hypothetical protein
VNKGTNSYILIPIKVISEEFDFENFERPYLPNEAR